MHKKIIHSFDRAAAHYDAAADLQQMVATKLARRARARARNPATILDIGCGTGMVAALAAAHWPRAAITGLDASPAMLAEARKKVPRLSIIQADAAAPVLDRKFDLIFSSMLLHWLPQPGKVLQNWRGLLNPGGALHVALPVAGSLREWSDLCREHRLDDGLWNFPAPDFARHITADAELERETIIYENLAAFLGSLKQTGAHQPRPGHMPASAAGLRRLLNAYRAPFAAGYAILYLSASGP